MPWIYHNFTSPVYHAQTLCSDLSNNNLSGEVLTNGSFSRFTPVRCPTSTILDNFKKEKLIFLKKLVMLWYGDLVGCC